MKKLLGVVLLVLVLSGVGFIGWNYWQNNKENKSNNNDTSQQTKDPSEGGKYLVIQEWGVRFKKGEKTQDLIYYYDPSNPDGINFGLSSLAQKYPECLPERTGLSQGLARSKNPNTFVRDKPFIKIGDYHYAVGGGGASCLDANAPAEETKAFSSGRGELYGNLLQLEKVQ